MKRETLVCILWTGLVLMSVLTMLPTTHSSSLDINDLTVDFVFPFQVVFDPWHHRLVADRPSAILVCVSSTFSTQVSVDINITYNFGTQSYLEAGPTGDGIPVDPGANLIFVPGGPAQAYSTPWIPSGEPPWLLWTNAGFDDQVEAVVDPLDRVRERDETNNGGYTARAVEIIESRSLKVWCVPVAFQGDDAWSVDSNDLDRQRQFMLDIYPVLDENLEFIQGSLWRCEHNFFPDSEWLYENVAAPLSNEARVYGYDRVVIILGGMRSKQLGWSGLAIGMAREPEDRVPVMVCNENLESSEEYDRKLIAHELGHTFYLWHPQDIGPPVIDATIYDPVSRDYQLSARTHMSYSRRPPYWIDEGRYCFDEKTWIDLIDLGLDFGVWQWNLYDQFKTIPIETPIIVMGGWIFGDGTIKIDRNWYHIPKGIPDLLPESMIAHSETFTISILNQSQHVLSQLSFGASFTYLEDMNGTLETRETETIPFQFNMPYIEGTSLVQIKNNTGHVLAEKPFSANPPTVEVTFPKGGESLHVGSNCTITWEAQDPDGDELTYLVAYSRDEGETWIPLGSRVSEKNCLWDTSNLTPGDKYLIRVIATDGVNTGEDVSDSIFAFTGLQAYVDIDPNAFNLDCQGKWITAHIELPEGYNVADINVSTLMLNDTISAEPKPTAVGDYDNDSIPDLMVKFDGEAVRQCILDSSDPSEHFATVTLTVTGSLSDGTLFQASDAIKVIRRLNYPKFKYWKTIYLEKLGTILE